jgi:DNA-binding response OmpR family regulator/class 3 adenylate cyclase
MRLSVLVVASDTALRAAIARVLVPIGYRVEIAPNAKAARLLVGKERFQAAVVAPFSATPLDFAFLHELQDATERLVILTENELVAKQFGFLPGALMCPSLPFQSERLIGLLKDLVRPKALLAEISGPPELLHFSGCVLDKAGRIFVNADGEEIALTRAEFALLAALVSHPGHTLSRAQLRDAVDGGAADQFDRSIDMLVARLRRKIEVDAAKPQLIITVPGAGYKFAAAISTFKPAARIDRGHTERDLPRLERRHLTVLCCQILGIATLAARSDPEDFETVVRPIYATCVDVIDRFGGTIMRALGDSVIAYFGYPEAREDDAERAVRGALELMRTVSGIVAAPTDRFRMRVGIASGLSVMEQSGSPETQGPTAGGNALNLALQMQRIASAGSVVIAENTRNLVGTFFSCRKINRTLPGESDAPLRGWRVVDEIKGIPRFEALHRSGMLNLIGRQGELERLSQCWSKARGGSGQVVLLTGDAGIGKSRVVVELEERLRFERHASILLSGSQHLATAPMSALLDELQRSAGITRSDNSSARLEKLRRHFTALGVPTTEATGLIAVLLGVSSAASADINELSPLKRKQRTFDILLARIKAIAAQKPVFAVVEDIQWVDPTSLEFIANLIEHLATLRVLFVIVGRSEFSPPWPNHSYVTTLTLSRMSSSDSAAIIHQVAGHRQIPTELEKQIISRGDGVPLFVEELTKSIVESRDNDIAQPRAVEPHGELSIPTTLRGLLLARFDRLERGKNVA